MAESTTRITNPLTISLWIRLQEKKDCGGWDAEIYEALKWSRNNPSLAEIKEALAELVDKGYATVRKLKRGTCDIAEVHFPTDVQAYLDILPSE